jgi:hypothetical protein
MSTDETFAVGDYVQWYAKSYGAWSRNRLYGKVTRVGVDTGALTIAPDDGSKPVVMRRSKYGRHYSCERVPAEAVAHQAWLAKRPATLLVTPMASRGELLRLNLDAVECDASKVDAIIAELNDIRAWLADRPVRK